MLSGRVVNVVMCCLGRFRVILSIFDLDNQFLIFNWLSYLKTLFDQKRLLDDNEMVKTASIGLTHIKLGNWYHTYQPTLVAAINFCQCHSTYLLTNQSLEVAEPVQDMSWVAFQIF